MRRPKRLYRDVSTERLATGQWQLRLDHKPASTPAGNGFCLPTGRLAEAIAQEWRSQSVEIHPETMGLTRLANTAIDRVVPDSRSAIAEILKFAGCDLLCFRAPGPDLLVERQCAIWDPLLDWARARYEITLKCVYGIRPIQQPVEDLAALEATLRELGHFPLAGLVAAANILGSAVLALALMEKRLDPPEAFTAAELDATYQAEIWGEDSEVTGRNHKKLSEIELISRFMDLAAAV